MRGGLRPPGIIALTVLSTISRALARLTAVAARLGGDRRGNVAIIFALCLPTLVMVVLGGMDVQRITTVRANLQNALDAATLAAARSPYVETDDLTEVGLNVLKANLKDYPGVTINDQDIRFVLNDDQTVIGEATIQVKTIVANVVLPPYGKILDETLPVGAHSEVKRSMEVEVALVLDVTGSMKGAPLASLKAAAKNFVNIVVQEDQTSHRSRVALVPYSMGVNLGDDYAAKARGPLQGTTPITAAGWGDPNRSISNISSGDITASNHGLEKDDYVWISGVSNASNGLNNRVHRVASVKGDTFRVAGFSGRGGKGAFRRCWASDCRVVVTSRTHTLSTGDWARISGVRGMTSLNNTFQVVRLSDDQFSVDLSGPSQSQYSNGTGVVQCGYDGCETRYFVNRYNELKELSSSTCVSERLWTERYEGELVPTDDTPGLHDWVGRNYPADGNRCLSSELTPLTHQVETRGGSKGLNDLIDDYEPVGSTAGQIGIEWGWYAVSPNFNALWPSDSAANDYDVSKTLKVVVLMTDGEFNNPYCQGVISRDAPTGGSAGNDRYQIGCSAPNGSPFAQSVALCDAMKRQGIVIFTVGFNLSSNTGGRGVDTAHEVMETCATTRDQHFFPANSTDELEEAFVEVGRSITQLRISR